jgi:hypothetical protein
MVSENADTGTVVTVLRNGNTENVLSLFTIAIVVLCREEGILNTEPNTLTATLGKLVSEKDDVVLTVVPIETSMGVNARPTSDVDSDTAPTWRDATTTEFPER